MEQKPSRNYTRVALAAVVALLIVGAIVYEVGMPSSQLHTTLSSEPPSSSSTAPVSTSGFTSGSLPAPGDEPTSYSSSVLAQEESAGLTNCTTQEAAFLNVGPIYSELGYPHMPGSGDSAFSYPRPAFVYFAQFPNGTSDVNLGDMQVPMITACQALGDAIGHLGISPENYMLGGVSISDAELNTASPSVAASWTFSFAMVHHGFIIDSAGSYLNSEGLGYAAQATVNAANGHTSGRVEPLSLPSTSPNVVLNLNSTQAIQAVRHTLKMDIGPASVANGTVYSVDLRVATMQAVGGGPRTTIQPVDNSTTSGQLRLVWVITTSIPNYVGFFVVDAQSGQVLESEGESTLPCGGGPCGTTTSTIILIGANLDYGRTRGMNISTESFEVNGSALGINGIYSVKVPKVIVMAPGSSGSIGVNFTNVPAVCSVCGAGPVATFAPLLTWVPSDISMNFSESKVVPSANHTFNETLRISISPNAAQGTYIVFFTDTNQQLGVPGVHGYFILSVWNGQGAWPVLPMLSAPLNNGQPPPIIFNASSTYS